MRDLLIRVSAVVLLSVSAARSQPVERIMVQDSTLDNFSHAEGYVTCEPGTLAGVEKVGKGATTLVLIPGLGFGGDIFREFMAAHAEQYTMYAVTLPGFGGTQAPPMPPAGTSFGELSWTRGAYDALAKRIQADSLKDLIVVGHWLGGTQLALWLTLEHPDLVKGVVIVAGSTRFVPTDTTRMPSHPPLDKRIKGVDAFLAPRWFKTVTRETWDDNNFLPGDYAMDPVRGLRLWREAASPTLPVWVRYLCEFYAQDVSLKLDSLKVPTLVLLPGLEDLDVEPGQNYMEAFCLSGWDGAALTNPRIRMEAIPQSRVCMWFDQPQQFDDALKSFLAFLNPEH